MDPWKCEECNMRFDSRSLYETHKKKFCGPNLASIATNHSSSRRSGKISPQKLSPSGSGHIHYSKPGQSQCSPQDQRMSSLEKEKVEELKALKASMSLERAVNYTQGKSSPTESKFNKRPANRTSRQSRNVYSSSGDREMYQDRLNELHKNHQEQLEQLRDQNKRLQEEKIGIQERMKTLGVRSRQKPVSQGSVDKQMAEFEGLKRYLDYKNKEISDDYETQMSKLNKLKNESKHSLVTPPVTAASKRFASPDQEPKNHLMLHTPSPRLQMPQVSDTTLAVTSQQFLPIQTNQSGVLAELNALRMSYLQGGGNDPMVLSQIHQLELEAQQVQSLQRPAVDPVLQQHIMAYHLSNQRLEQELQSLRAERQENSGHRKTPDLSPEFRQLKAEHLEKMTALRQEGDLLKQQTEIERMKKELQELRGDKTATGNDKQVYETPFMMSSNGMEKTLLPSPYDPSAGFSVFWDFILGMSPSYTKCRLAVGIYNGTDLVSDVKLLPMVQISSLNNRQHPTIPTGGAAVLGITHPFPKCAPLQSLSLVVELQANSIDDTESPHKLFSRGWTKMDLFDVSDRLLSGRWKIPCRVPPIKTYLNSYEMNRIPQAGLAEVYIRLVNARDVRAEDVLTPQPLQHYLYKFPSMENPAMYQFGAGHRISSLPNTAATTIHPAVPPPSVPPPPETPGTVSLASVRSNRSPGDSSLLGFQVDKLYDAIAGEVKIRITAYNQQDGEVLKATGDTPVTCVTKIARQDFLQDIYSFGLQEALFRHVQWNSSSVVVLRIYLQPSNTGSANLNTANLLDESKLAAWTILPLTLRGEAPAQRQSRQSQARTASRSSRLNIGTHRLPLFFPPVPDMKDVPVQMSDCPEDWSRYGSATLRITIFSCLSLAPERPMSPPEFLDENATPKDAWIKNGRSSFASEPFEAGSGFDLYVDSARFFPDSVTFSKVAGRVLDRNYNKVGPDIEAQAKLESDIYHPDYDCRLEFREPVFPATSTLMLKLYTVERVTKKLVCMGYAVLPVFLELGTNKQPASDNAGVKVSLNDGAHQIRIYSGTPDLSQTLSENVVQSLTPIPCASLLVRIVRATCHPNGRPKETSQFQESEWEKEGLVIPKQGYDEGRYYSLSCEPSLGESQIFNSFVMRQPLSVREAIKFTGDGQEQNMKKDQVIASWIKTQLTRSMDSAPGDLDLNYVALYHPLHGLKVSLDGGQNLPWANYTSATFCLSPPGSFYKISSTKHVTDGPIVFFQFGRETGGTRTLLCSSTAHAPNVLPLCEQAMADVFIDVIPQGDREDALNYSTRLLYSSDINSPVWMDEIKALPSRIYQRFLVLVIHLHEVTVDYSEDQESYGLKGQGWTVLQVFHDGYVLNGCYQLPLYQGEPSEAVLKALQNDSCQDVMASFRRKKIIKYLEGSSVFLRLSDTRRVEELSHPKTNARQDYLPKDKLDKYQTINPSTPISSLVPSGVVEAELADSLPRKFKEMLKQIFDKNQRNNAPKSK